ETPEQRVARLRAAHEKAKNAKVSRFDKILAKSRPFFDSAHRVTVISLVGLTAVAGLMTAYTAYDMLRHNRQRKLDFMEAQKRMAADSLEAARLAYMRGDATDEQMAMVDEANTKVEGFHMPSILSAPKPLSNRPSEESTQAAAAPAPRSDAQPQNTSSKWWGLFSGSKKAEEPSTEATQQPPRTLEEKRAMLESARAAFEKEKENQQRGGPLDRVG
ncbi:cytochrome oxidase c assembly-domain-containing protein, partial [Coniella lustricola]